MNERTAIIFHSEKFAIEAYHSVITATEAIQITGSFTTLDNLCSSIDTHDIDFVFVGHIAYDRKSFICIRDSILLNSPSTKVVMLGYQWFNQCDELLIRPVRGVIDLTLQSKAEIRVSLNKILQDGWDFKFIIRRAPELEKVISAYACSIPEIEDRFWKLLPLLATNSTHQQIALYFGVSRRTILNLIDRYCNKLGVVDSHELMILATENRWLTRQAAHAASDRISRFLLEVGYYD